jgi:helicase SWR1
MEDSSAAQQTHNGHDSPPSNLRDNDAVTDTSATLKIEDSSIIPGSDLLTEITPEEDTQDDGRPSKRRRLTDVLTPQRSTSRAASPPWKKPGAEGPTTFFSDGKRKSARTNTLPLELQPHSDKRRTRAAVTQANKVKSKQNVTQATKSTALTSTPKNSASRNGHSRTFSNTGTQTLKSTPTKRVSRSGMLAEQDDSIPSQKHQRKRNQIHRTPSPPRPEFSTPQKRGPGRPRTSSYAKMVEEVKPNSATSKKVKIEEKKSAEGSELEESDEEDSDLDVENFIPDPNQKPQRLRLKLKLAQPRIQHPSQVTPQKQFSSFREWLDVEGVTFDGPKTTRLTDEEVKREARIRDRLNHAAKPGGLLDPDCVQLEEPENQEEPQRQYTRHDFTVAHAIRFQHLLEKEHKKHAANARKYAYDALIKWKASQPKSEEELRSELEEQYQAMVMATMKQCIRDLNAKWDLFRSEIQAWRLERWKEEQITLNQENLNRVIEESGKLLDSNLRDVSILSASDNETGIDEDTLEQESGEDTEDNMSLDESEDEDEEKTGNSDDELTAEELRKKYEMRPLDDLDRPPDKNQAEKLDNKVKNINSHENKDITMKGMNFDDEEVQAKIAEAQKSSDKDIDLSEDESTDMDSGTDESDEDEDEEDDEGSDSGSEEESVGLSALLGGMSKPKTASTHGKPLITEVNGPCVSVQKIKAVDESQEDEIEASMIPDAAQVQTPLSNNEAPLSSKKDIEKTSDEKHSGLKISSSVDDGQVDTLMEDGKDVEEIQPERQNSMPATPISVDLDKKHIPPQEIPHLLRATLREYQKEGFYWLADRYKHDANGILADEMGLGKTIQTITLLAHLALKNEIWGPHLVVVPTSVILNWEMEFKKFLPGFKVLSYYGNPEERKAKRKGWLDDDRFNVVITSYHLVVSDQNSFKRRGWHYLILDEAHNIKNFRSQRWQTLLTFRSHSRLLLTGTPLQNNLEELWSLLFFLVGPDKAEEFLGRQEFAQLFKKPADQILEDDQQHLDKEAREQVQKLHQVLRPRLLRRLKADVEKQMPGKYEHVVYCRLSKRQRYLYDGFLSRSQTRETLARGNYLSIINCLMQLRKVCNHPDLFETRPIVTSFAMKRSVAAEFEIKDLLIRRRMQEDFDKKVNLDVVNLLPSANGSLSALDTIQKARLNSLFRLRELVYYQTHYGQIEPNKEFDGSSASSALAYMENSSKSSVLKDLQHRVYLASLRSQRRPLYSHGLAERLTIPTKIFSTRPPPKRRSELIDWWSKTTPVFQDFIKTLPERSEMMHDYITKFTCVTPAVVAPDLVELTLGKSAAVELREVQTRYLTDSFHEPRIRQSIAFPDKRLLQFDCGKLQRLDELLRTLQSGGHRALIFTQMTKVLDILEQFLNIHGHRYLRLDGSTKLEQRQILTERFNSDPSILVFILSSRSGGLGINLTGADTVIFYDLDWNPAMDKQCQDRCHRIGQTRDVHIYRFVSEHTIEANILRKSNQKRLLDDVIIQEGDFTTDYFNKPNPRDIFDDQSLGDADAEASAAFDRVLGIGNGNHDVSTTKIFEQAEDREDRDAARERQKELDNEDADDFVDRNTSRSQSARPLNPSTTGNTIDTSSKLADKPSSRSELSHSKTSLNSSTTSDEMALDYRNGEVAPRTDIASDIFKEKPPIGVDRHMVEFLEWECKDVPFVPPDFKKKKRVDDHRVRRRER